jgi:hypothetical protein
MSRMLLLVPRMYSESEFKRLVSVVPEDFGQKTSEFWSYVEEKLRVFDGKIQRVYRDETCKGGEDGLAYLSSAQRENFLIVKRLVENGAIFEATEDPVLVAESESWREMINQNPLDTISMEMYQVYVGERDDYVSRRIDKSLLDEEIGILFTGPTRSVNLNDRAKIIKVCGFDPADYLRSWQVQLKLKP